MPRSESASRRAAIRAMLAQEGLTPTEAELDQLERLLALVDPNAGEDEIDQVIRQWLSGRQDAPR